MDAVQTAIFDAWKRIAPRLAADPGELQKRLARRWNRLFRHPPRAWCIAVRASDTRLNDNTRVNLPPDEFPPSVQHSSFSAQHCPHQLTLDAKLLRQLCTPVRITPPGETLADVASRLGVPPAGLLNARVDRIFSHHYIRGLGGYWGKPRPLIYTDSLLDPATKNFLPPDPAWTWTASLLPWRIPDDLPLQTLLRVPRYLPRGGRFACVDRDALHPEHPANDPPTRRRKSLALPPPPPDPVWYKWKAGQYVGHDWRNPLAAANHLRHQQRLEKQRAARRAARVAGAARSPGFPTMGRPDAGSLEFRGYDWLCPHCQRRAHVLFLPLEPINLLFDAPRLFPDANLPALEKLVGEHPLRVGVIEGFACEKCHRIRRFTSADPNAWNEIICYLTGGLLFGREVHRPPQLLSRQRRIPYRPRPNRAPSQRRPQIERMLLAGKAFREIATALGLVYGTVLWYAQQIYKRHGVRTLPELLRKHGHTVPPPPTIEVRRRLLAGQSIRQIAAELGCGKMIIYNQRQALRKQGTKLLDGRDQNGGRRERAARAPNEASRRSGQAARTGR